MIQHDAVCDVCRQQLHQRLLNVKSPAETPEIVEKLKTLEQEIHALKSSGDTQQKHSAGPLQSGIPTDWSFFNGKKYRQRAVTSEAWV